MAAIKTASGFLKEIKTALSDTLRASGITATVKSEPVRGTKLFRLAIIAPQFKNMKHSERQSLVWRIVENTVRPEDQMRISMILTLTQSEASGIE